MRSLILALLLIPAAADSGAVRGIVTLKGGAPPRKTHKVPTPGLEAVHQSYPDGVPDDPVPVDQDQRVGSVFVYVKKGLEGKVYPVPKESKQLRFEKYQIQPRMTGVMTGQEFVLTNLDPDLHALQSHPRVEGNRMFNVGLPAKGPNDKRSFAKAEVAIPLTSNCLHEWERAWIAVVPHPYYAVTDDHGAFEIRGLPPGRYTLEAWQENCAPAMVEVEVKAAATQTADFTLEARR